MLFLPNWGEIFRYFTVRGPHVKHSTIPHSLPLSQGQAEQSQAQHEMAQWMLYGELAEIPAELGDPACKCSKSQMPSPENICQPLCLLVATLASSSCRTHWIPISILVHSSAALLAIPCCFLINSGTLTDVCSLPKGSHCKCKAIQLNINWESQQHLHESQLDHQWYTCSNSSITWTKERYKRIFFQ